MPNPEHLAVLKQGAEAWNAWRWPHLFTAHPDLSHADLSSADLHSADLTCANLNGAFLNEALLSGANLAGAHLVGTVLTHATLVNADLTGADLTDAQLSSADFGVAHLRAANLSSADLSFAKFDSADLRGADLRGADLFFANLASADLTGANLTSANLIYARLLHTHLAGADFTRSWVGVTFFAAVDLSQVLGLGDALHFAPSTIGIDTLYLSKGHIRGAFLIGCGVPNEIIALASEIAGRPVPFASCFICYSDKDAAFGLRLYGDLQRAGVRCWHTLPDQPQGTNLRATLDEAIRCQGKLLLVLSASSLASQWVQDQVQTALAGEPVHLRKPPMLFLIRLDDAPMQTEAAWAVALRNTRHIGDFTRWQDPAAYQVALARLLRDLQAEQVA